MSEPEFWESHPVERRYVFQHGRTAPPPLCQVLAEVLPDVDGILVEIQSVDCRTGKRHVQCYRASFPMLDGGAWPHILRALHDALTRALPRLNLEEP